MFWPLAFITGLVSTLPWVGFRSAHSSDFFLSPFDSVKQPMLSSEYFPLAFLVFLVFWISPFLSKKKSNHLSVLQACNQQS